MPEELRNYLDVTLDLDTETAIGAAVVRQVFPIRENPFGAPVTLPSVPDVQGIVMGDGNVDHGGGDSDHGDGDSDHCEWF